MKLRLFALALFVAFNAVWFLLAFGVWTLGVSTVREDAQEFPEVANNALVILSQQPWWIPATGFLLSFAIFAAWFFWPGLRPWLSGIDFDDVRSWSISFDWNGCYAMGAAKDGTRISIQACRLINLSATQARVVDIRFDLQTNEGSPFWLTSRSFAAPREELVDADFMRKFKRTVAQLETPLTIEPNKVVEGAFALHWPENAPGTERGLAFQTTGPAKLTVFEHRSQQSRWIRGGEAYDAKQQRRYRGEVGYPQSWWNRVKLATRELLRA